MITADFVQVRANSLILYRIPMEGGWKRHQFQKSTLSPYSGKMTGHLKKRLNCALDIMVQKSPTQQIRCHTSHKDFNFRIAFMTLTQPPDRILDARQCYDLLLKDFLQYMKRKSGLKRYVWKFEQQKNGQGHYHIATPTYIPWELVRWKWNKLLKASGQLDGFAKRYGHFNAPSTEIKSMVDVDACLQYCQKEISKSVQNQTATKGKIWDASTDLKIKRYADFLDTDTLSLIDDGIQHGFAELVELERCSVVKMDNPKMAMSLKLRTDYESYIN